MIKRPDKLLAVFVFGMLSQTSMTYAIPTLHLSSGATTVVVSDGSPLDSNPDIGAVLYLGPVGPSFYLNVSTGVTDPILGTQQMPHMDLSSVDVSGGGGTLTVRFSDTDYGPTKPSYVVANLGGTTGGSVAYNSYLSLGNTLFGGSLAAAPLTGSLLTSIGPLGPGAFSGSDSAELGPLAGPYALTLEVAINHSNGVKVSSFNAELLAVPDGGSTVVLLGVSLLGFAGLARRRDVAS